MKHLGDITKIDGRTVPKVCVVIGGSPCQDLSVAGKRSGLSGERSGLFMEMIRIIKEMREDDKRNGRTGSDVRPRFMVWENVPGAFSSNKGEDFRIVLEEIVKVVSDCTVIPRPPKCKWRNVGVIMGDGFSVAWRVLDAQFWGVPQRRRRIALVADFGGCTAPEILFERESLSGDSSPCGTPWEGTAGEAENCADTAVDGVKCLTPWDCQSKRVFDPDGSMSTYQAMGDGGANNVAVCYSFDSLASNSMKSSNPHSGCREVEVSKTLDTTDPNPSKNQGGIAVVQPTLSSRMGTGGGNTPMCMICIGNGQVNSLGMHEKAGALNCMHDQMAVMIYQQTTGPLMANSHPGSYTGQDAYNDMLVAKTLRANGCDPHREDSATYPVVNNLVRRLTPLECERLQGFPDGWTDIGEWTDTNGKSHKTSDSARYKALGNSIALPPWRYVLSGVIEYCNEKTMASLFDGIGGFPLIWRELGGNTVWASEIEEFPIAVTKKHFN